MNDELKQINLEPVLARIKHVNSLGESEWYEVIYFDALTNSWNGFEGGTRFEDGEQVVSYRVVTDLIQYLLPISSLRESIA